MKRAAFLLLSVTLLLAADGFFAQSSYGYEGSMAQVDATSIRDIDNDQTGYSSSVEAVLEKSRGIARRKNKEFSDAMKNNNYKLGKKIIYDTGESLSVIIKELQSLNPPEELKAYHAGLIEEYRSRKILNDEMLKKIEQ